MLKSNVKGSEIGTTSFPMVVTDRPLKTGLSPKSFEISRGITLCAEAPVSMMLSASFPFITILNQTLLKFWLLASILSTLVSDCL